LFDIPEIPYAHLDAEVIGAFALAFVLVHLGRPLTQELRPRHCVFCGVKIRASDYEDHLEICGLKRLQRMDDDQIPELEPPLKPPAEVVIKKVVDRPHWTTFIAPTMSVLVGLLALSVTVLTFQFNRRILEITQRPFVSATVGQLDSFFDAKGKPRSADFEVVLNNTGNTEALGVLFEIASPSIKCSESILGNASYRVMPHATTTRRLACTFDATSPPTTLFNGKLSYLDNFGQVFREDQLLTAQVGKVIIR